MGDGLSASFLHCEKKRSRQIWGCVIVYFFGGSCLLGVGLVWSISLLHLERQELGGFGAVIEFGIFLVGLHC